MTYDMENFRETVLPENKLSEGKQSIIKKLQEMKGANVSFLESEAYLAGVKREKEILEGFESSSPLTIIKASKDLFEKVVRNPEKMMAA